MLEQGGPGGCEVDGGFYRDHMVAYVDHDGNIRMQVDFYHLDPEEEFDVDVWENMSCNLSGKASRENWRFLFQVGRALARHGQVAIKNPGGQIVQAKCDGGSVSIQEGGE